MTVYLDLWSGRRISGVAKWRSVRVFGLIHGPPENSSLAALSVKIRKSLRFTKFTHPFHLDNNPAASETLPIH